MIFRSSLGMYLNFENLVFAIKCVGEAATSTLLQCKLPVKTLSDLPITVYEMSSIVP